MDVAAMSVVYVLTTRIPEDGGIMMTMFAEHTLKHNKEELTLVELGSYLRIEESLRVQDSNKPKSNNVASPHYLCDLNDILSLGNKKYFVTFTDDASRFCYVLDQKIQDYRGGEYIDTLYFQSVGVIHEMTAPVLHNKMGSFPDPKLKTLSERGIECIFVGYAEHSKAFRFSSVPRPSLRIPNGTEDIGGSVVPEEVVQQPEPELRKSKRNRTPKDFGPEFQLYLIEGTRDEVSDQHSYCFNVEDDPKTFDEAMKSQDVAFWKEAINDEMDSIMGNNTWVLADLPPGCKPLGCKWIFKRKLKVDGTIEKFKARLVIQGFKQKSGIDYFDTYAPVARISTIRLLIAMASIHNLIIHQMDVKTAFLNGDLEEEVYMNQPQGFIMPGNENKVDDMLIFDTDQVQVDMTNKFLSSRFSMKDMGGEDDVILHWHQHLGKRGYPVGILRHTKYNSSTSGWVFLLGGGAISWSFKKQTCITGSTMEFEFVALAAAGKEAEWLKNLLLEIPLWSKPVAPISICCDSAATLAKAYSQMYNRKSRHLYVRHSMIRELITDGVISIEFVRSQQNLADHLTKGLARDLVIKSAEGMGLKGLKHMYLHIIQRMCLEPAEKEDEVFASQ
ncbi:zinc finger, CCHC-type containing protein [Tanacetum coccineum]